MTRDQLDEQIDEVMVMLVTFFESLPTDEAMQTVELNLAAIRTAAAPADLEWMESRIDDVLETAKAIADEFGTGKGSE
jgi:hypothetical protein